MFRKLPSEIVFYYNGRIVRNSDNWAIMKITCPGKMYTASFFAVDGKPVRAE
ncbi:MAG TPA: hypothetical protein PK986_09305 [Spirochaetota bacterium]|nr:hypothetical protein [Spirochaetota bacterium]